MANRRRHRDFLNLRHSDARQRKQVYAVRQATLENTTRLVKHTFTKRRDSLFRQERGTETTLNSNHLTLRPSIMDVRRMVARRRQWFPNRGRLDDKSPVQQLLRRKSGALVKLDVQHWNRVTSNTCHIDDKILRMPRNSAVTEPKAFTIPLMLFLLLAKGFD